MVRFGGSDGCFHEVVEAKQGLSKPSQAGSADIKREREEERENDDEEPV